MSLHWDDDWSTTKGTTPAPLNFHEAAIKERNAVDFSSGPISMELAQTGKAGRPVRIYADGIYDIFHYGHARQLLQAKCAFPSVYLIVGVAGDVLTHRLKGHPVMNEKERCQSVRYCRFVDEVFYDAPWTPSDEFLIENKIDFVAHDNLPYVTFVEAGSDDIYSRFRERGRFVATERTDNVSTSDIITRIIRDYDRYVQRYLQRGLSGNDLNLSLVQNSRFRLYDLYNVSSDLLCKACNLTRRSFVALSEAFRRSPGGGVGGAGEGTNGGPAEERETEGLSRGNKQTDDTEPDK